MTEVSKAENEELTKRIDNIRVGDGARAHDRTFFGVSGLLFIASAAVTIIWCTSMSAMGGMPMPGGWTMSMTWMRMPGQTWPSSLACGP